MERLEVGRVDRLTLLSGLAFWLKRILSSCDNVVLWMDEILHHFEAMGNHLFVGIDR